MHGINNLCCRFDFFAGNNFFSAQSFVLAPGQYTLSFDSSSNIDVAALRVPAPAPGGLALVGLALAGLGAMRRRRTA